MIEQYTEKKHWATHCPSQWLDSTVKIRACEKNLLLSESVCMDLLRIMAIPSKNKDQCNCVKLVGPEELEKPKAISWHDQMNYHIVEMESLKSQQIVACDNKV